MWSVENEECENVQCGKKRAWKMCSVEHEEC